MPFSKLSLASVIMAVGAFLAGAGTAHAQVSISKVEVIPQRIVLDHKGEGYAQIVMTGANIGPAGCGIEIDYGGGAASDYLIYGDALLSFGLFSSRWRSVRADALPIVHTKRFVMPGKHKVRVGGVVAGFLSFGCLVDATLDIEVVPLQAAAPAAPPLPAVPAGTHPVPAAPAGPPQAAPAGPPQAAPAGPPPAPACDIECKAGKGDAAAANELGLMHLSGEGAVQSDLLAVEWFRKAAALRHPMAVYNLALLYEEGRGVPQSQEEAQKTYEQAVSLGSAEAVHQISLRYARGPIPEKNLVLAFAWSNLAVARLAPAHREKAVEVRRRLEAVLSPQEVAQARRISVELDARYPRVALR